MKKLIDQNGIKNEQGQYIRLIPDKPSEVPLEVDVSLDDIGKRIILALERATKILLQSITSGDVTRDTIGALKDCEAMYKDLKKAEADLLDSMSDEELKKAIAK